MHMDNAAWNTYSPIARMHILMACGWVTRSGNLNPTGKRLFKTNFEDMSEIAKGIIVRHLPVAA